MDFQWEISPHLEVHRLLPSPLTHEQQGEHGQEGDEGQEKECTKVKKLTSKRGQQKMNEDHHEACSPSPLLPPHGKQ